MPRREHPAPGKTPRRGSQAESGDLFRIFVHNDEITPMDFVVHVLVSVFLLPTINAEQVMYSAHLTAGRTSRHCQKMRPGEGSDERALLRR